jgi:hypothetical protein
MAALRADDDGGCQTGHEELVMEDMPSTPYAESHHAYPPMEPPIP